MRYLILLALLVSNAHAVNRDQMNQLMDGEDEATVLNHKKIKRVVAVAECSSSLQCKLDEICYKASTYDVKGVCIKKPKD